MNIFLQNALQFHQDGGTATFPKNITYFFRNPAIKCLKNIFLPGSSHGAPPLLPDVPQSSLRSLVQISRLPRSDRGVTLGLVQSVRAGVTQGVGAVGLKSKRSQ